MALPKKERKKRGLRTEKRYIEGAETYAWERKERKKWGGRWFNKQADPVVGDKSYPGAKAAHRDRFTTERSFGIKRGDPKR